MPQTKEKTLYTAEEAKRARLRNRLRLIRLLIGMNRRQAAIKQCTNLIKELEGS